MKVFAKRLIQKQTILEQCFRILRRQPLSCHLPRAFVGRAGLPVRRVPDQLDANSSQGPFTLTSSKLNPTWSIWELPPKFCSSQLSNINLLISGELYPFQFVCLFIVAQLMIIMYLHVCTFCLSDSTSNECLFTNKQKSTTTTPGLWLHRAILLP